MSDWLIVGLGNPGVRYARTRHNLGFLAVQALAKEEQLQKADARFTKQTKWEAEIAKLDVRLEGTSLRLHLFLPLTYMNCCGPAIERYRKFYNIPLSRVIILVDDVALAFGQIRFREKGSSGGHNGLKSITQAFGTAEYPRLRIGVGLPTVAQDLADYVLAPFSEEESLQLPRLLRNVVDFMLAFLKERSAAKEEKNFPLLM